MTILHFSSERKQIHGRERLGKIKRIDDSVTRTQKNIEILFKEFNVVMFS